MRIDTAKCERLAKLITEIHIPADQEELTLDLSVLPVSGRADFLFSLVAVCHQTKGLQGQVAGGQRRGWDYLSHALLAAVATDHSLVSPTRLQKLSGVELCEIIRAPDNSAIITDVEGRARLLNNLGEFFVTAGMASINELHTQSGGFLCRVDSGGILQRLASVKAYSDPVRKKSLYFCMLAKNQGLWKFKDPEHLGPPVDYHEIRGHLRLGTVIIEDGSLLEEIRSGKVAEEADIEIRRTIFGAIMEISRMSGETPAALHYFFWNLFRSCCLPFMPHCAGCPDDCQLPERYVLSKGSRRRCSLESVCESRSVKDRIGDYSLNTEFY